jgi:hypothetical protein
MSTGNKLIWEKGRDIPNLRCILNIPEELRVLGLEYGRPEFVQKQFQADMVYNYKIKKEERFEVAKALVVT